MSSRTSKIVLSLSLAVTTGIVAYVHIKQQVDSTDTHLDFWHPTLRSSCNSIVQKLCKIQRQLNCTLRHLSNGSLKNRTCMHEALNMCKVKEETKFQSLKYKTRLEHHPNQLAVQLSLH